MGILVLGIGNLVMTDDGIGVRAVQLLAERYQFPAQVVVMDGGTLGLDLLPRIEEARRVIIIDAVETGAHPGTLVRLAGEEIPQTLETKLSPHQMGLKDLLTVASLLGHSPEEVVLLGVQPGSIGMSMELTEPVQAQLEPLVGRVLDELAAWGVVPLGEAKYAGEPGLPQPLSPLHGGEGELDGVGGVALYPTPVHCRGVRSLHESLSPRPPGEGQG